jgi:hypothetical protein
MTLVWRPGFMFDADASTYIEAVEAADEAASPGIGALETNTRYAINNFVIGCKQDGIWSAIKASCILAGARTLDGALVPLVGAAPTNNNFVSGDYSRETGLVGDGSTKYLGSNRNNNSDPQDSKHLSVYVTAGSSGSGQTYIGVDGGSSGASGIFRSGTVRINTGNDSTVANVGVASGLFGASRSVPSAFTARYNGINQSFSIGSQPPSDRLLTVFVLDNTGSLIAYSSDRLAFYSIGEALDLGALDGRVTDLITAIGAAIP